MLAPGSNTRLNQLRNKLNATPMPVFWLCGPMIRLATVLAFRVGVVVTPDEHVSAERRVVLVVLWVSDDAGGCTR